ncbi:MAG: alkaline phosphatase [Desulfovibrionaceae bacterium]
MKYRFRLAAVMAALLLLAALVGCKGPQTAAKEAAAPEAAPAAAPAAAEAAQPKAKYVFLFIGDGMGIPQRAATSEYVGRTLVMDGFPAQGITTTRANDRFITGSAASATALASGTKTNINFIGVDPNLKPVKTIAEMARDAGMKVGVISSVSIDHATPAAFYAHVKTRKMYHEIAYALGDSGFDFFGGGGMLDPEGKKSKAPLGDAIQHAKDNGYVFATTRDEIMALQPGTKAVAVNEWLQDGGALPYTMDMTSKDVSLPEFTGKAIELLGGDQGFFLMVEGGKIDWACHANDAAAAISNNIAFDDAVQVAVDFAAKHPEETLIVVTGDHECGGLTLGFAGTKYDSFYNIIKAQKISFQKFTDEVLPAFRASGQDFEAMKPIITENFGLKFAGNADEDQMVLADFEQQMLADAFARSMAGETEKPGADQYLLYGEYDPLAISVTHVLNQKAGLGWTSYSHTGVPVTTSAMGAASELFNGSYDNTDVALKLMRAMGFKPGVEYLAAN